MKMKSMYEKHAIDICSWKYDGKYSIYNLYDWDEAIKKKVSLTIKAIRDKEYVVFVDEGVLIGYGRIKIDANRVVLGIGIKPSLCGKGHGQEAMNLLIAESKIRYPETVIVLSVRTFNIRAIKLYKKCGFVIVNKYIRETPLGKGEFFYMEKL